MVRSSGTVGFDGRHPVHDAGFPRQELDAIPGVRAADPIGQTLDRSDPGFGSRLLDGITFDEYVALDGFDDLSEGSPLHRSGDQAIMDTVWQKNRQAVVGSTVQLYERPFAIVGIYEPPGGGRIKIPLA